MAVKQSIAEKKLQDYIDLIDTGEMSLPTVERIAWEQIRMCLATLPWDMWKEYELDTAINLINGHFFRMRFRDGVDDDEK